MLDGLSGLALQGQIQDEQIELAKKLMKLINQKT